MSGDDKKVDFDKYNSSAEQDSSDEDVDVGDGGGGGGGGEEICASTGKPWPQGAPPPGQSVCDECGCWKSATGKPFNSFGLAMHRKCNHGIPFPKGMKRKEAPEEVGGNAPSKRQAYQRGRAPMPEPEHEEPEIRFAGPDAEEDRRFERLKDALYVEQAYLKPQEMEHIKRAWSKIPSIREDPVRFDVFLMELEPLRKREPSRKRIVETVFFGEGLEERQSDLYISPYQGRSHGSPSPPSPPGLYGQRQGYGQQGQGYGPPTPPRGKQYTPEEMQYYIEQERYAQARQKEVEEANRRALDAERRAEERERSERLTADDVIRILDEREGRRDREPDPALMKQLELRERELELMKDKMQKDDVRRAADEAAAKVKAEIAPVLKAVEKEKTEVQVIAAARDAARAEAEKAGGGKMSDETRVMIEEARTERALIVAMVTKADARVAAMQQNMGGAVSAVVKGSVPIQDQSAPKTKAGLTEEEIKKAEERLGEGFVED